MSFAAVAASTALQFAGASASASAARKQAGVQAAYQKAQGERQARMAERQYEGEAQAAETRAMVADRNAALQGIRQGQVRRAGIREKVGLGTQVAGLVGQQLAALAANGMDVAEGSAADITEGTIRQGKKGQVAIMANAEQGIFDLEVAKRALDYSAVLERTSARNLRETGRLTALNLRQLGSNQASLTRYSGKAQATNIMTQATLNVASKWASYGIEQYK